jgi:hypothetical protein
MSGGTEIVRNKGKRTNEYVVKRGKDRQVYTAFGANIPEPVADQIGIGDINFQGQHDAPYWFCKTPGEVSRQLNEIINLDEIDRILSWIQSKLSAAKFNAEQSQAKIDRYKDAMTNLAYVDEMTKDLEVVNQLEDDHLNQLEDADRFGERIDQYRVILRDVNRKTEMADAAEELEDAYETWKTLDNEREQMAVRIRTIEEAQRSIDALPSKSEVQELRRTWKAWREAKNEASDLYALIYDMDVQKKIIGSNKARESKIQARMDEIMKERCPLCLRKL